ncbi:hypothetical protein AB3M94_25520 [Peribacillus frigoritolerans]
MMLYGAILSSMAHEIIHYQQWLEDKEMDEKEAENGSEELLDSYYRDLIFLLNKQMR